MQVHKADPDDYTGRVRARSLKAHRLAAVLNPASTGRKEIDPKTKRPVFVGSFNPSVAQEDSDAGRLSACLQSAQAALCRLSGAIKVRGDEDDILLRCADELDPPDESQPDDPITIAVALGDYSVSAKTIHRAVKAGKLHDYRPAGAPDNAALGLSRAEVASRWPRKK